MTGAPAAAADGGIAAELHARHGHSAQPESQQVLAVLAAVLDVVAGAGIAATPAAIFAALMSALERPDAQASPVTAQAMCTVLATTLSRVPNSVLRAKFVGSVQLLGGVVDTHRQQAAACKAALLCLGQVVVAVEPGAWHAAAPGFQLLVSFVTDARPKVRKRAQASVTDVLAALQGCPANLTAASQAVIALCKRVLPGPAAAARAAAAASNKQRSAAEAVIAAAVSDVLHLLGALKSWGPLMAGSSLPGLVDLLIKLYTLHQPLLSRHTSEVLGALAGSGSSHLAPQQLAQLLGLLVEGEAASLLAGPSLAARGGAASAAGGDQLSAMARLLEAGLMRLAEEQPASAGKLLPRVVHLLVPLLSAEQDGVRYSASGALQSLIGSCLTPQLLGAMQAGGAGQRGLPPLQSLVAAVASSLGARYQEAWSLALPVAASLCEAVAAGGAAPSAEPLVLVLGHICAGLSDEAEQREEQALHTMELEGPAAAAAAAAAALGASSSYASAAEAAMGAAIRCLGPEMVLRVLPLDLQQGLEGSGEARTWLLPALRRHVSGAQLRFWADSLLPLARQMGAAAGAASARGNKGLAGACHALELQLWGCLLAFASWPSDAAAAYTAIAPELAAAFHTREDLRGIVASALVRLCRQARVVALAALEDAPHGSASGGGALGLAALQLSDGASRPQASAETRRAISALGLVSPAAAAVPGAGTGGDCEDDAEQQQEEQEAEEDSDEEHGAAAPASARGRGGQHHGRRHGRGAVGDADAAPDAAPDVAARAPASFDADVALAQLGALRALSAKWLPLLCKVYLQVGPEARGLVGEALAAYATVSEAQLLSNMFRVALSKYAKIVRDAAAPVPPPDPVLEGGGSPEERQAAFLELALCLAAGLPDAALEPLFAACRQHVLGGCPLLQKRAYRVLAYLVSSRPAWLRSHLAAVLELLLLGSNTALSPAKRYRLRCLRPIILLLDTAPCPPLLGLRDASTGAELVPGAAALAAHAGGSAEERRVLLAQLLVGELVLATKEVNKKTRGAAYQLLVELAHELDEARPLTPGGGGGDGSDSDGAGGSSSDMEYGDEPGPARRRQRHASGGLLDFVSAVMAGLVGATPHMQSAAVLALARLVFEFAGQLEGVVSRLLPAVLLLLRSQSREVIKAVLGFIKVCAMRMPVDLLLVWLPQMLEGMLLWADDSKNKFRLKIRVIVERLVRRCGFEAVASACPPGDAKLMAHIRKQQGRKERRRAAGSEAGGSQADEGEFDARSRRSSAARSSAARTARASEWGHTAIFSDEADGDGEAGDARSLGGASSRGGGRQRGGPARSVAGTSAGGGRRGTQLAADAGGADDPQDLLEPSTARQLVRGAAAGRGGGGGRAGGGAGSAPPAADFPRGDDGRLVIREEPDPFGWEKRRKRKRGTRDDGGAAFGSDDDSDMDDMRGIAGLDAAVKSVANAKSVRFAPTIAASLGNRSLGGASAGGASTASRRSGGGAGAAGGKPHSGERYKAKAGAGGDVKGGSRVDPYAYWQFDRKMLNRRRGKQATASKGLSGVVAGAKAGALKGGKAKRAAGAKRARH